MLLGDPYFSDLGHFYDILQFRKGKKGHNPLSEKKSQLLFVLRCFAFVVTFQNI